MRDVVNRIGVEGERAGGVEMREPCERDETEEMHENFEGDDGSFGHIRWVSLARDGRCRAQTGGTARKPAMMEV